MVVSAYLCAKGPHFIARSPWIPSTIAQVIGEQTLTAIGGKTLIASATPIYYKITSFTPHLALLNQLSPTFPPPIPHPSTQEGNCLFYLKRVPRKKVDWAKYLNRHGSKSIWVIKLSFCQNDSPMGGSFWQKDSLITHILFELCLFKK